MISAKDIKIRNYLKPGDIGYVIYLHGKIYGEEYGYGLGFEGYVAESMAEFCKQFDPEKGGIWVCEHGNRIIGFLSLVNREEKAQLRYFLLEKEYRGLGLGNKLMDAFMELMKEKNYQQAYLLTSDDLPAAASLYMKRGFTLTEEEPSELFGKKIMLQRYELDLRTK
nr:GNAT family N-acetyltransferase [Fulvivirga sedimenti]